MGRNPLEDWLDAGDAPLPDDLEDQQDEARRPRLGLLLAAAAIPLVALGWLWAAGPDGLRTADQPTSAEGRTDASTPTGGDPAATSTEGPGDAAAATDAAADPSPGDGTLPTPEPGAGATSGAVIVSGAVDVPAQMAAVAAASVRLEMSRLAADEETPRYVDLAVADGLERHEDLVVVTVLAVVLEGAQDRWTDTTVRRFAVPLSTAAEGGPVPAGAPWHLPAQHPLATGPEANDDRAGPRWTGIDDPPDGTADALEAAGFVGPVDMVVAATEGHPLLRVEFTAESPAGRHEVWITRDPEPRVLGTGSDPTQQPDRRH